MAISDRITSIEEHIKESYQELEGIGIDTTGVNNNLENIPKLIDGYWETLPKVTGEGTSITLDNTKEGKMKIDLKGNTSQATTTGKNLLKNTNVNSGDNNYWSDYSTYDEETGTLTRSTTTTTESFIAHKINLKSDTKYTISCLAKSNGYVRNLDIFAYNSTTTKIYSKSNISLTTNFQKYSFTFTTDGSIDFTNATIRFDNNGSTQSGTEAILTIKDVMLVEGEDTEFEPYTNGASPNPDYPQDIHVVSGDNSINVVGKNLFSLKNITNATSLGVERTINNSELKLNGTTTGSGQIIGRQTSKITLSAGTYSVLVQKKSGTVTPNGKQTAFYFRKPNGTEITSFLLNNYWGNYSFKTTFVLSEATELYVELYCNGAGYTLDNLELQFHIESGYNLTPTYEAYIGESYPINLPEGMELCKIGDYQDNIVKDNGKWYVKKEVGKFYSNSTTGWNYDNNHRYYRAIDNIVVPPNNDTVGQGFCNVGLVTANQTLPNSTTSGLAIHPISRLYISENVYNNISTTPTVLYYAYITPIYTEITDSTLISQLNALAKSYTSQTNISQESNDLASLLNATALEEM